jgi:hypothetical protein
MCCQYYAAHLEQSIEARHDRDMRLEEPNLDVSTQNMQFQSCLRAQWSLEY